MKENNDLIIVVVAESGSGKGFIIRNVLAKYPNISIATKYTTRKSRIDEANVPDVKGSVPLEEILQMDYGYVNPKNHEHYAFKKEEVDQALQEGKIPCLELANEESYLEFVKDYPGKVLLLKIEAYMDEETMKRSFERQGRPASEFEERKSTLTNPLTDWVYKYPNRREIVNPAFLRSIPLELSLDVLYKRIESIVHDECKKDLGYSYWSESQKSSGLYDYFYYYSKNRPADTELDFSKENRKLSA